MREKYKNKFLYFDRTTISSFAYNTYKMNFKLIDNFYLIIFGTLIVLVLYLFFELFRLKKRFNLFFQKGKVKNLEEVLTELIKKINNQQMDLEEIKKEILNLNKYSRKSFQKIGLVRFNPFREVGGDQSFSIAILDFNNNGVVMTSHYGQNTNRVYSKLITRGKSQYSLSEEEKRAIEQAINS